MENEKLIPLVKKAQAGNRDAIEALLNYAHTPVSYQCRKMLPNPQDAEDLTQEVLLTVYTKLDTLQEPAAFSRWLNRITATRCMNALTRAHVDLQFSEDEEGNSVLDNLETLDEQQIPDKALDNAETARMIDEIVSGLPEAQRMSTLLYYFDEMSVKEIAQIMSVSESAVKGRLNLARKAIKDRVLSYEKQGVKLYSVSVLPFLCYFLHAAASSEASAAAAAACTAGVMAAGHSAGATAATGAAGKLAGKAAVKTAVKNAATRKARSLAIKIIAGILGGTAATVGVVAAVVMLVNRSGNSVPPAVCQHEWREADCTQPRTCQKCGSTEGEALGHQWVEADCENPKTCSVCGTTEGAALGHKWVDADCENPKTCSVCGATEGEALGHQWIDANYQSPQTCSVCGAVTGSPLTPDFEKYGLKTITPQPGVGYKYVTCTNDDFSIETIGTLYVTNYREFVSDETHEGKDGYLWHTLTVRMRFDDENAWMHGMYVRTWSSNYFDIFGWSNSHVDITEQLVGYTVNYNGVDYPDCLNERHELSWSPWVDKVVWYTCDFYWRVPVGYDGFILSFYNASTIWEEGQYIFDLSDENTLHFRFNFPEGYSWEDVDIPGLPQTQAPQTPAPQTPAPQTPTPQTPPEEDEGGYYWATDGRTKIYHDCATEGHYFGQSGCGIYEPEVISPMTCSAHAKYLYKCQVKGCDYSEIREGTQYDYHTIDPNVAQLQVVYLARCSCGTVSRSYESTEDTVAMATAVAASHQEQFGDSHYVDMIWQSKDLLGPATYVCTVCGQTVTDDTPFMIHTYCAGQFDPVEQAPASQFAAPRQPLSAVDTPKRKKALPYPLWTA